ncbi:tRNA synthetases class I (C) catalytic domain-containing protein [Vararia minispora EC-137]|uniref:tRNA synthetases class I (C) catalytic domain-containing protein n=1 Tax=Vararia minispora EC-137 TaxID=1314806 RepID=A0ACB8Q4T3_9AGAM|nr:tRNA synthetases class I (C) catalytic domain-containing protein [Vararia minispora EC-137]
MATQAVSQPPWTLPASSVEIPVLKVYNSLTRTKNEFVPREGRRVKWYNCGPTVYDASHMGHARNYVTQDILRRILSDYFGYDVHFVMNITDIEDKIILRARQTHLLERFRADTKTLSPELLADVRDAWTTHVRARVRKGLVEADAPADGAEWDAWPALEAKFKDRAWRQDALRRDEKFEMHFNAAARARSALEVGQSALDARQGGVDVARQLIDEAADVLAPALDAKLGATVTDPSISRRLSSYWERRFFDDMDRLRVRRPDTITRVTEYVPEIVVFVERIVDNGYGYALEDGSVYFDTRAFDGAKGHVYAKLEPWSRGNRALLEEAEGALASTTGGKRSPADFALWKASKPGEPAWESPWGPGRPGWHIECSVMASAVFGESMDIHSGGIDLAFPHHDNEVAQSEAYHECHSWVNYFLHTGHLHIEGLKMSKSLKNFITIDEILQRYSARQLRLAFLTTLWSAKIDFSESLMTGEVKNIEATLNNFFTVAKALVSQARADADASAVPGRDARHGFDAPEQELTSALHAAQDAFRAALCDSFNTPAALDVLRDLVSRANVYVAARGAGAVNAGVVERVARWVGAMLRVFGLGEGERDGIGWGQLSADGGGALDREEVLMPYLRALSTFRDGVRARAIAGGDGVAKDILALCDGLRDDALVPLGVALDDQEDGKALVKLVPPAELVKARDAKRAALEQRAAQKAAAQAAERERRAKKLARGRAPPWEMFRAPHVPEGKYGGWDADGVPTTDGAGAELSKNARKGLLKEFAAQRRVHEEYLAWRREEEAGGREAE